MQVSNSVQWELSDLEGLRCGNPDLSYAAQVSCLWSWDSSFTVLKEDCDESHVFWSPALQQTQSVLTEVNYLECMCYSEHSAVLFGKGMKTGQWCSLTVLRGLW